MTGDYYLLKTEFDPKNCVVDKMPSAAKDVFRIKSGERMGNRFPKDATLQMSDSYAGQAVTDSIANTFDFLIVSDRLKQLIAELRPDDVEYLPVQLRDHKKKPVAGDFWVVNLLGTLACADAAGTEGKKSAMDPGQFLILKRLQVVKSAIPDDLHVFRLGEMTSKIVVSDAFRQAAKKARIQGLRFVGMGEKI